MRSFILAIALMLGFWVVPTQADYCENRVGMALVLAFDSSSSINETEWEIQVLGTGRAFQHPDIIQAVLGNPCQKVAVAVVGWSDVDAQALLVDWEILSSEAHVRGFGLRVTTLLKPFHGNTSIAGGIRFSVGLLQNGPPFVTERKVIDISGDGEDETDLQDPAHAWQEEHHVLGRYVGLERKHAETQGVTINTLPMLTNSSRGTLKEYFDLHVRTADGFTLAAYGQQEFATAMFSKLLQEIAWAQ